MLLLLLLFIFWIFWLFTLWFLSTFEFEKLCGFKGIFLFVSEGNSSFNTSLFMLFILLLNILFILSFKSSFWFWIWRLKFMLFWLFNVVISFSFWIFPPKKVSEFVVITFLVYTFFLVSFFFVAVHIPIIQILVILLNFYIIINTF